MPSSTTSPGISAYVTKLVRMLAQYEELRQPIVLFHGGENKFLGALIWLISSKPEISNVQEVVLCRNPSGDFVENTFSSPLMN